MKEKKKLKKIHTYKHSNIMFSDHNKNKISINIYFLTLLYFYFIFSIIKIVPKINTSVLSALALVGVCACLCARRPAYKKAQNKHTRSGNRENIVFNIL